LINRLAEAGLRILFRISGWDKWCWVRVVPHLHLFKCLHVLHLYNKQTCILSLLSQYIFRIWTPHKSFKKLIWNLVIILLVCKKTAHYAAWHFRDPLSSVVLDAEKCTVGTASFFLGTEAFWGTFLCA
jgi:hypothetical protein